MYKILCLLVLTPAFIFSMEDGSGREKARLPIRKRMMQDDKKQSESSSEEKRQKNEAEQKKAQETLQPVMQSPQAVPLEGKQSERSSQEIQQKNEAGEKKVHESRQPVMQSPQAVPLIQRKFAELMRETNPEVWRAKLDYIARNLKQSLRENFFSYYS